MGARLEGRALGWASSPADCSGQSLADPLADRLRCQPGPGAGPTLRQMGKGEWEAEGQTSASLPFRHIQNDKMQTGKLDTETEESSD